MKDFLNEIPSVVEAITLSKKMNVPLHPAYTYYWKGVKKEEFEILVAWLEKGSWKRRRKLGRREGSKGWTCWLISPGSYQARLLEQE